MSSNCISREMDTKQLALKTSLGKCLHFKGEERTFGHPGKMITSS